MPSSVWRGGARNSCRTPEAKAQKRRWLGPLARQIALPLPKKHVHACAPLRRYGVSYRGLWVPDHRYDRRPLLLAWSWN